MDSSSYTKTVANTPARSPFSPTSSLGGTTAWTKVWSRLYIWNEWWRNWIITGIPKLYYLEFIKLTSQRNMKCCQDKAKQIPTYSHCSVHCVSQKWVTTKKNTKKTHEYLLILRWYTWVMNLFFWILKCLWKTWSLLSTSSFNIKRFG